MAMDFFYLRFLYMYVPLIAEYVATYLNFLFICVHVINLLIKAFRMRTDKSIFCVFFLDKGTISISPLKVLKLITFPIFSLTLKFYIVIFFVQRNAQNNGLTDVLNLIWVMFCMCPPTIFKRWINSNQQLNIKTTKMPEGFFYSFSF